MTITINGIVFTDQQPTVPGPYLWTPNEHSRPSLWWIGGDFDPEHDFHGGLWCRLAPAALIEDAFKEGFEDGYYFRRGPSPTELPVQMAWEQSNANKAVEGGV